MTAFLGGLWEFKEWTLLDDEEVRDPATVCAHAVHVRDEHNYSRVDPSYTWVNEVYRFRRVIVAKNEGGYNSTGLCGDCVLAALTRITT